MTTLSHERISPLTAGQMMQQHPFWHDSGLPKSRIVRKRIAVVPTMNEKHIKVRVAGVFGGDPMNELLEEPLQSDDTPATVLARFDKRKIFGRKFFANLIRRDRAVFLLNGERIDFSDAAMQKLKPGDEISVISAIAGG